jgi:surfeit locus 1 family protein
MVFRPLPVLTTVTVALLAALLALGMWQAQRAQWKADLIEEYETSAVQAPESLEAVLCQDRSERPISGQDISRRLILAESAAPLRVFGHSETGVAGWRLFAPIEPPACAMERGAILVEIGLEPLKAGTLPTPEREGLAERYRVAPWPARSWLAADNAPPDNDWHWFDAAAMTQQLGVGRLNDGILLVATRGLPDHLRRTPPSRHIGYSATWFGMAIALAVMYLAFHIRAGRLRFSKASASS